MPGRQVRPVSKISTPYLAGDGAQLAKNGHVLQKVPCILCHSGGFDHLFAQIVLNDYFSHGAREYGIDRRGVRIYFWRPGKQSHS